jgi:hypothetical protein
MITKKNDLKTTQKIRQTPKMSYIETPEYVPKGTMMKNPAINIKPGLMKPEIKHALEMGIPMKYRAGGGATHFISADGSVEIAMPLDAPPDEKGRWRHNAEMLEKKNKVLARLRAKFEAKQAKQ